MAAPLSDAVSRCSRTTPGGGCAVATHATKRRHAGDDMVARREIAHPGSDGGDDARRLVPGYARHRRVVEPLDEVKVGVTDAGSRCSDPDFSGPRVVDVDLFDGQRFADGTQDRRSHPGPPRRCVIGAARMARASEAGSMSHPTAPEYFSFGTGPIPNGRATDPHLALRFAVSVPGCGGVRPAGRRSLDVSNSAAPISSTSRPPGNR